MNFFVKNRQRLTDDTFPLHYSIPRQMLPACPPLEACKSHIPSANQSQHQTTWLIFSPPLRRHKVDVTKSKATTHNPLSLENDEKKICFYKIL
jgi:hypothetical protein